MAISVATFFARLVEAHIRHVVDLLGPEVEARAGSPAQLDQQTSESGPAGPWVTNPPHTALSLANLKRVVAQDHLGSLNKLLVPPITLFGPMVAARASVEASAFAYWILDPALSVRDRVARAFGERMKSATEETNALTLLLDDWEDPGQLASLGTKPPIYASSQQKYRDNKTCWRGPQRARLVLIKARVSTSTCALSLMGPTTQRCSISNRQRALKMTETAESQVMCLWRLCSGRLLQPLGRTRPSSTASLHM